MSCGGRNTRPNWPKRGAKSVMRTAPPCRLGKTPETGGVRPIIANEDGTPIRARRIGHHRATGSRWGAAALLKLQHALARQELDRASLGLGIILGRRRPHNPLLGRRQPVVQR